MTTIQETNTAQSASMQGPIGRLVAVSGSQAVVMLNRNDGTETPDITPPELGTLVKVETAKSLVVGLVSALSIPVPSHDPAEPEVRVVELEFVGELPKGLNGTPESFRRGVSNYPAIGHMAFNVTQAELQTVYAIDVEGSIRIGTIVQESSVPAMVNANDLLGKHFAVLGSTGTGKSCATALLLRNILKKSPHAHILLLDPHREYAPAFGNKAEVVTAEDLTLPFWLLTFEEMVEIVIGQQSNREADIEILRELIPMAKSRYGAAQRRGDIRAVLQRAEGDYAAPSVDTPVPYRISDLVALIEEHIGKLELRGELAPFKRLKARLTSVSRDPHFSFMFGSLTIQDNMADILGRLFRVPVNGKPISIIELAGLPAEVINVVVSVLSRMSFDLALWSNGRVPITLVCEEAHRYVPRDTSLGFEPTKRALSRIAKEGRKYGVSLCIVSQRPAELDPTILSQCNTIFGMRLPNERDQEILRARVSDSSASLLEVLPSLGTGEAVVFGEGVALPTRMRFDRLPEEAMPRSATAEFTKVWQSDVGDSDFLSDLVTRWRSQIRGADEEIRPLELARHDDNGSVDSFEREPASELSEVALAEAVSAAAAEQQSFNSDELAAIVSKTINTPVEVETAEATAEPALFEPERDAVKVFDASAHIVPGPESETPARNQNKDDLHEQMSSLQRIIADRNSPLEG